MPAGTSFIGTQLVNDLVGTTAQIAFLNIAAPVGAPPNRIGFMYTVNVDGVLTGVAAVIDTRPVYSAGVYFRLPNLLYGSLDRLAFWVDWDVAGIDWTAGTD